MKQVLWFTTSLFGRGVSSRTLRAGALGATVALLPFCSPPNRPTDADGDDEKPVCVPEAQEACFEGPPSTLNVGRCRAGMKVCNADGTGFGACEEESLPQSERCDTLEDDDCDGEVNEECSYVKCADIPAGSPSGVYQLNLEGLGKGPSLAVYCDTQTDGGGWALVYRSVGSTSGTTTAFWSIPYLSRLMVKGSPAPGNNVYVGALYPYGREYRDEVEDLAGKTAELFRATTSGIRLDNMIFSDPKLVTGTPVIYGAQFASGWASSDFDADPHAANCASAYANITQHYSNCWRYNLGADAKAPFEDGGWGPHLNAGDLTALGLMGDGTPHPRVARISRWTRW